MITRIQKWGNSQGVRITKPLLFQAELEVGELVSLSVEEGALVVTPLRRMRRGQDLKEMVARVPKDTRPEEIDWGWPEGREGW